LEHTASLAIGAKRDVFFFVPFVPFVVKIGFAPRP
jgi:hypothetical protein